jgi:hypothetical protein
MTGKTPKSHTQEEQTKDAFVSTSVALPQHKKDKDQAEDK